MKRLPLSLSVLVSCLLVLSACGGVEHPHTPTIEELRVRAAQRPSDPDAQSDLAEAELLLLGGDAERADVQLQRALALSPDDLGLRYLAALEHKVHGSLSDALDGYLDVIRRAARSDDPNAAALAEIAAAEVEGLDDSVERYAERVAEALEPVHASPGRIGDGARSTIGDLLIDLSYRRGDLASVREIAERGRCVTEWRVAGPIGPRHLLGFDQALAPDGDARLADRYDHGPGRGTRETRALAARGCNLHVGGGPVAGGGTTYAEGVVSVPSAGRWLLRLETPNAVELFVDGESTARVDRRQAAIGRASYHALDLTAGEHRIRVKIASRHPNPVLQVSLSVAPLSAEDLGSEERAVEGEDGRLLLGATVLGEGLLEAFARVSLALAQGDVVAAREAARPHLVRDGSAAFLISGAAAAVNDPLRSSTVRHDTARRLLTWAGERDPSAWSPTLTLAQLEANEGRTREAIVLLSGGATRWPEVIMFPLQLVDYLEQQGWHAQASEAVDQARAAVETACRPRRAAFNQARRQHRAEEITEHARALTACDARSDAMLTVHVLRRQWDEALVELDRLAALEPEDETVGELQARLSIARGRGNDVAVQQALSSLRDRTPQASGPVLAQADRALATSGLEAARNHLQEALGADPEAMSDLRRPLRAIGGESPLESYRRDGAEVIDDLEASGRRYSEPMVLVFDYTVYRVFEDGATLELTHNIFRLQSQEAVDAMGEFNVPEGAQMLTLHTVKADGTRLPPDEIEGKDTISFPNLSPGDYIEFEYLRAAGAPAGYPNGFLGDRFYFRNYETPFDLSQLTVVTPRDLELTIDPRGAAPATETSVDGDTRVHRWTVRESRPFTPEPSAVSSREFFPSIYWGRGATWDMYVESLRDLLADRDVRDPSAVRLVRQIVGDASRATPEMRAELIYHWVLENIEDNDDVFGVAPQMVASRTGNRTRVLRYLLSMAGLEADLALARSFANDPTEGSLPDEDTYQNLLVRVRGTTGPVWLHAGARGAPFGYIPPPLAGMDALMLDATGARVELPPRSQEEDLRSVEADVALRSDGGARVRVVETFRGAGAVLWRNQLEGIPAADLEQQFESAYVANVLPGGQLVRLRINGRESPNEPVVLSYEVELSSLARRAGDALLVPPLFRAELGPQYAPVASRQIAQIVPGGLALDVEVRVRAPEGMSVATGPEDATSTSLHGARFSSVSTRQEDGLATRRQLRIPRMRVTPSEYPELAAFCRATDEIEAAEVRVR